MQLKTKLLMLSILSFPLLGCGPEKDKDSGKDSYSGPVEGTAQSASTAEGTTPSKDSDTASKSENNQLFGENKRFMEKSPSVLGDVKYISSAAIKYNFGNLIVNGKADWIKKGQPAQTNASEVRIVPFTGWIRYPQININKSNKKFPIIIFLHGQHSTKDPSYQGYDYMAKTLAEQGYVVLSLDANAINGTGGDESSQSRAQLILGTIDKLKQLDDFGGAGILTELKGKLDFNSIGMMGHSRGGQGIYLAIKFNTARFGNDINIFKEALVKHSSRFSRHADLIKAAKLNDKNERLLALMKAKNISFAKTTNSVRPYNFKGAFALAPTDFEEIKGITNVPLATLIPSCDGDVSDLQGVNNYDNNRFSMKYDTSPKFQILVRGANHNYYNSTWVDDDFGFSLASISPEERTQTYCNSKRENSVRLNPDDQRNMGQFIMNSFMRYFVGGEQQFKPYWNAVGQLPKSACPKGDETCDERVILSVQKNGSKLIQRFEESNALTTNLFGGFNKFTGFSQNGIVACRSFLGEKYHEKKSKCTTPNVPAFYQRANTSKGGLVSSPDQLQLTWDKANPVYSLSLNNIPTQGYDSLTFRVAIPLDVGQEVLVELTDINGKVSTVTASDFSDALYAIPRKKANGIPLVTLVDDEIYNGKIAESLNMVSIPLKAFQGIDTAYLSNVTFRFPKGKGTLVMNDIQLQKLRN